MIIGITCIKKCVILFKKIMKNVDRILYDKFDHLSEKKLFWEKAFKMGNFFIFLEKNFDCTFKITVNKWHIMHTGTVDIFFCFPLL